MHQFQLILGDYFRVYEYAQEIAKNATSFIGWINNHSKVRVMFNRAQADITFDCTQKSTVLSYLVANLTHWTTHCIAFMRLLRVCDALKLEVMRHCGGLIAAQVGMAKYSDKEQLTEDTEKHCNIIKDPAFWNGLEHVVEDIEPICYATNINQKDSAQLDQVLMTLIGIYLHFNSHPIKEVATDMTKHLEKCWKDCDQPLFLLALILNLFEGLS